MKKQIFAGVAAVVVASGAGAVWLMNANPSSQSTEDAYVEGNIIQVTPQIGGSVTMIAADNTDFVKAGQPLVRLNDVDTQLAVSRAEAQLSRAVRQVRVQFANATQNKANVTLRATELARVQADLARRKQLAESGAVSGEDVHHAEDAVKAAQAAVTVAEQQLASSQALVDQTSIESHPDVQAAIAQLRDAYVAQSRTTVYAPAGGHISKRSVQIGQRVNAGSAVMSIVPPEQMWVNANFKESQLRRIRIGQPVELVADVYGKSVRYSGRVIGQEAGTGSAFSLLPAQNASGNWIKVIQRVPVRIALDPKQLAEHPLKLGLSMHVEVDTSHAGSSTAATAATAYRTDVFNHELQDADAAIARIIAANVGAGDKLKLAKVN